MGLILKSMFRKTWMYASIILIIFTFSLIGSILFQHFQDERAASLISTSIEGCKVDILVGFKVTSPFNVTTDYKILNDFFGVKFSEKSLNDVLAKRIEVSNPTPKEIEKFLPKGYSYIIHKVLIVSLNYCTIRDGNRKIVRQVEIYIFQDDDPILTSLSKIFKINFSKEALMLSNFECGNIFGILGMNDKVVFVSPLGMNSTLRAKVELISNPGIKAWDWLDIGWTGYPQMYLMMSKSYFLKENNYTYEGAPAIGIGVPTPAYEIEVKGLTYFPFLQRYISEVNKIAGSLARIGGVVYEPKAAAIKASMKALSFLISMTNFENFIACLLASFINATIVAIVMISIERKAKMLMRIGIDKRKILGSSLLMILIPLGISFLASVLMEYFLKMNIQILLLSYFIPSLILSLWLISMTISRLYSGEEVFWRKVVSYSLLFIIGVVVLGILIFIGNLTVVEKGYLGHIFSVSLFYYILFLILVPVLISAGIGFIRNKRGRILWTKIFKGTVPKSFVSAVFFLLILVSSSYSMIAISSGAEEMMANYLAWDSLGADVVYHGTPKVILGNATKYGPHVISFLEEISMYRVVINGQPWGSWGSLVTMNPTELKSYISCKRLPYFIKRPLEEIYEAIKDNSSIVFLGGPSGAPNAKEVNVTLSPRLPGFPILKREVALKVKVINVSSSSLPMLRGINTIIPRKAFAYITGQNVENYTSRICYVVFDREPPLKEIYQILQGNPIDSTRQGIVNSILGRFSSSLSVLKVSSRIETIVLSSLVLIVFGFLADSTRRNAYSMERIGINKRRIVLSYSLGFLAISAGAFSLFSALSYGMMNIVARGMGALWTSPPPILEIIRYVWPSLVIPPLLALIVGAFVFRR